MTYFASRRRIRDFALSHSWRVGGCNDGPARDLYVYERPDGKSVRLSVIFTTDGRIKEVLVDALNQRFMTDWRSVQAYLRRVDEANRKREVR